MSKRFGRNQRRKLQAALKGEQGNAEAYRLQLHKEQQGNMDIKRAWEMVLDTIIRTTPEGNLLRAVAGIESRRVTVRHQGPSAANPYRVPALEGIPAFKRVMAEATQSEQMHTVLELWPLLVDAKVEPLRGSVLARLQYGGRYQCLAFSEEALRHAPVEWLARSVATELIQHLQGEV